jgi:hypothetical protein
MNMEAKKPWFSKTILFGAATAMVSGLAMVWPNANFALEFLNAHYAAFGVAWGIAAMILRVVSKDKIQLTE